MLFFSSERARPLLLNLCIVPLFTHVLFMAYTPHFQGVLLETHLVQLFLSPCSCLLFFCLARSARNEAMRCAKNSKDAPAG
jgi:hypothetical protein